MLFDLRGRGRRRTVQGIYLGLALLMGGGLIFFGVGGSGVGIFGNDNNGGGDTDTLKQAQKAADKAEKKAIANPRIADAWAQVVIKRSQQATQGKNYDAGNNAFTAEGQPVLRQAATAWDRYLALKPEKADLQAARRMVVAYSGALNALPSQLQQEVAQGAIPFEAQGGLDQPGKAADAQELVVEQQPTLAGYYQLTLLSYLSKPPRTRLGDLAEAKAIALAPKKQRKAVKTQIDQDKSAALQASLGGGQSTTPSLPGGG